MLNNIKSEIKGCSFISFAKTKYFNEKEDAWLDADGIKAKINGKGFEVILPKKIEELTDRDLEAIKEKLQAL